MKTYRFKLKPLSPWSTPWDADTLFAALAWHVLRSGGGVALREFLAQFQGGTPPFVLSSAFPEGWLPCPLSVGLEELLDSNVKRKRPALIPETQFRALITKPATIIPSATPPTEPILSRSHLHASIDRVTGTTSGEGSPFEVDEWYLQESVSKYLTLFVKTQEGPDVVHTLLESLSREGFGKKRSSGRGAFKLVDDPEPCDWMDSTEGANAFVSLSPFVPAVGDPPDGRWGLTVKYPKFSPEAPVANPFKGRLVLLRPGSVFRVASLPVRPFYGKMITNLKSDFPNSVHCAMAFAVPICWPISNREQV
jgi:CRISPR-associated protein Csm4